MGRRTLIATMGFDERHVLPALRLMPYDRLVVVAGRDTFRSAGFRRLKDLEPSLRFVVVRPFDLLDSLGTVRRTILDAAKEGPVRLSVSGGTKILVNAAILAAFLEGIPATYVHDDTYQEIPLPLLRITYGEGLTAKQREVLTFLVKNREKDFTETALARALGVHKATMNHHLRELDAKGAIERLPDAKDARKLVIKPASAMDLLVG